MKTPIYRAFALLLLSSSILPACAAVELNPGAEKIIVTKQPAPQGCRFLGTVIGEQGGSISGKFTSNANLQEGAVNDMKNKAHDLGGNYVVLENTNAGNTLSGDRDSISGQQTDVTHMGNTYSCPPQLVGLL
ncbi:DUF4156 domain-containing protein [Sorangium cellulosum]|uniref:DUF4156 domain-containing protein n=1 Tax=Sorangium cellulosum TaxID=56 RepID=A0A150QNH2_SORCE|nr:DUF4156 domain-containing protein [Sorangium cellulosum]KYF69198.1 hypothetical protein BE15_45760 [Sorangium cellulosum]